MKLPSAETLREQIASDPDDEPTAGPVEAPEAALTSKERLTRLDHYGRTLDDLAIDGQWYFCLRSEVQPLLDRQRGEIESLKRELSAYQECEKLAAPLSCPLHGLVPNLASFDNKCPDCERDRLRAALEKIADFDCRSDEHVGDMKCWSCYAREALSSEPSPDETTVRRMTRAEADAMERAFWRSVEIIDELSENGLGEP